MKKLWLTRFQLWLRFACGVLLVDLAVASLAWAASPDTPLARRESQASLLVDNANSASGHLPMLKHSWLGEVNQREQSIPGVEPQSLPSLGDGSAGELTPQAERKLGERVMRSLRGDPDYLNDWLSRDYFDSVADKLARAAVYASVGGYVPNFELFPIRDAQINAFSLPGGFIGINTGLIASTQTESELAAVLAHEIGHVLQRHIARMMGLNSRSSYAALAGLVLGALAGIAAHSADLGQAIALGGQAYALDNQLRFSRSAEREADRVGFRLLTQAGYDAYAMPAFFKQLERASFSDGGVPAYVRTHPLTIERIADMTERARREPYHQPQQNPEYAFVRVRLLILQETSANRYEHIARQLRNEIDTQTAANPAANWYGIALTQMLQGRYAAAQSALDQAEQAFNRDTALTKYTLSLEVLKIELARYQGRIQAALALAEAARRRWPSSRAVVEEQWQAQFAAKHYAEAQLLAQQQTRIDPTQANWWKYLAQSKAALGDTLGQRRALAEQYALEGAWSAAIEQLQTARHDKKANFYDLSVIDARLREIKARYKETLKEEKND